MLAQRPPELGAGLGPWGADWAQRGRSLGETRAQPRRDVGRTGACGTPGVGARREARGAREARGKRGTQGVRGAGGCVGRGACE